MDERNIAVDEFHKVFHVPTEEVPIITLSSEQLRFLVQKSAFHDVPCHLIYRHLRIFLFLAGTVALRVSDVFAA
jgi:hypothetical protein